MGPFILLFFTLSKLSFIINQELNFASCSDDNNVKVFNQKSLVKELGGHGAKCRSLEVLANDRFVTGAFDGELKVWSSNGLINRIVFNQEITSIGSFNETHFLVGTVLSNIFLFNSQTKIKQFNKAHNEKITSLKLIKSEMKMLSTSLDDFIFLWDIMEYDNVDQISIGSPVYYSDFISHNELACSSDNGKIIIVLVSGRLVKQTIDTNQNFLINSFVLIKEGTLAMGLANSKIKILNLHTNHSDELSGHTDSVLTVELIENNILASGSSDNKIKIWNLTSKSLINTFYLHSNNVNALKLIFKSFNQFSKPYYEKSTAIQVEKTSFFSKSIETPYHETTKYSPYSTIEQKLTTIMEDEKTGFFSKSIETLNHETTQESPYLTNEQKLTSMFTPSYLTTQLQTKSYTTLDDENIFHQTTFSNKFTSHFYMEILKNFSSIYSLNSDEVVDILTENADLNDCLTNCSNNGICRKLKSKYTCECFPFFQGSSCQIDKRQCSSHPCLNNGTCFEKLNETSYECECDYLYHGKNCELKRDVCVNETCSFNGKCLDLNNSPKCKCFYLFSGDKCDIVSSEKKLIKIVSRTSSIIALGMLILFFSLFICSDLSELFCSKPIKRKRPKKKHFYVSPVMCRPIYIA